MCNTDIVCWIGCYTVSCPSEFGQRKHYTDQEKLKQDAINAGWIKGNWADYWFCPVCQKEREQSNYWKDPACDRCKKEHATIHVGNKELEKYYLRLCDDCLTSKEKELIEAFVKVQETKE